MSLSSEQKINFEHRWTNHLAKQHLSRPDRDLWHSHGHTKRTFAYPDKEHVIWRPTDEACEVLDVIRLIDASLSFLHGPQFKFASRLNGSFIVTSIPSRLPGLDVFVWVPPINEVRFVPRDWDHPESQRSLRVGISFKQRHALSYAYVVGEQYVTGMRDFKRIQPNAVI